MISLRRRLFLILLTSTGLIWLCAVAWISISSRAELERVLDTRLQEAARMVHSLAMASGADAGTLGDDGGAPAELPAPESTGYERQLSCQIWSFDGRLLARSSGAPTDALTGEAAGFSNREVNGETWRVYTIEDPARGARVVVGDRIGLRDRLVLDLVAGLAAPALFGMPLLGLLIWLSLGRGLRPLSRAAEEIAARDGDDMRPVASGGTPSEIQPLIGALNGLFAKVEAARRHERDVTAFAAHELRTPLAGLKTQAQVALAAREPQARDKALGQILLSVDRTSRMVRQILALARLDAGAFGAAADIPIGQVLHEIVDAVPLPAGITVRIAPELDEMKRPLDREALGLLLKNLHENAVQHSFAGGTVQWQAADGGRSVVLTDEGPGIEADELDSVRKRFYRGRKAALAGHPAGAGLGLAIAELSAQRLGAILTLSNRTERSGLRVELAFR